MTTFPYNRGADYDHDSYHDRANSPARNAGGFEEYQALYREASRLDRAIYNDRSERKEQQADKTIAKQGHCVQRKDEPHH